MTKRVVGYRRLSPDGSNKETIQSKLENQLSHIEDLCDENGMELVEVFTDKRVSGRKTYPHERDGWREMVDWLTQSEEGEGVDGIVMKDLSRWSRRVSVAFAAVAYMSGILWARGQPDRELSLYSAMDDESEDGELLEFDDMDSIPMDIFFNRFLTSYQDQEEASKTAKKVQEELDKKVVKGKPPRGLTTDKRIAEETNYEVAEASRWLPLTSAANGKGFGVCLEVCWQVEQTEKSKTQIGRDFGFPEGSEWDTVNRIWKNRHKYALAILWHRQTRSEGQPWYENKEEYNVCWDWLDDTLMTEKELEVVKDMQNRGFMDSQPDHAVSD